MKLARKFVRWARHLISIKGLQRSAEEDYSIAVPFRYHPRPAHGLRIAAICHLYFTDLASEMLNELGHIPCSCDLFISTNSDEKKRFIEQIFSSWRRGSVEIRIVENRG